MLIPKGSIIDIDGIQGALAEEVNIQLKSTFKPLFSDFQHDLKDFVSMAGSTVRSMSGGRFGFSGEIKQFTSQIWDKTDPARFNLNVEFHRVPLSKNYGPQNVSGFNVMNIVKKFCSIPLPEDNGVCLVPPGPSPIEGIGIEAILGGGEGVNARGFVNLTIGSMKFYRILMESAEPTFSKYVDESDYPISCRIVFNFVSVWAATKKMVEEW